MKNLNLYGDRRIKCYVPLKNKIDRYETLEIMVYYSKGGINYFSGCTNPRGYKLSFKPCTVSGNMTSYTMLSGNTQVEGYYVPLEDTARYNKKRLIELAAKIDPYIPDLAAAYEAEDKATIAKLCEVGNLKLKVKDPDPEPTGPVYQKSNMMILTKEIKETLPKLYSQDSKDPKDVQIAVKFFDPTGSWTWYATEGEPTGQIIQTGSFKGEDDYKFFGYVKGFEGELGYFTLGQLSVAKTGAGMEGLPIERDRNFTGTLAEVMTEKVMV